MLAPQKSAVTLDGLTLGYGARLAVEDVSGAVPEGELLALVGPNGAGKSTLLKAIAGLHHPSRGGISLGAAARPAYMAQHSEIDRSFPLSALDFTAMGLWREASWWRPLGSSGINRAQAALAKVGLAGFETRRVGELSGGQLRRVLFARAMLQDAPLILLDEPFAAVDAATTDDLVKIVHGWHRERRTIIVAVHDLHQVRAHFPAALLLARRVVAWGKPDRILTNENLAAARTLCSNADKPANAA